MPKNCCRYVTVSLVPAAALVLAVVFAAGILLLPILYQELTVGYKYALVIDAGSTHSSLFVYRWKVPTQKWTQSSTGEVHEIHNSCPFIKPLNNFTSDPSQAQQVFTDCIKKSYDVVPDDHRDAMPIYLGATAGMRLVKMSDPPVSKSIMENATVALHGTEYKYGNASILTGRTEAAAGWATANYAKHKAMKFTGDTIGSLDMGGASMEVAFQPLDRSSVHQEYLAAEELFGQSYELYARSYLCYGQKEAHSRYLASLVAAQNLKNYSAVHNPCLFKGATVNYTQEMVYSLCVNSITAMDVFGSVFQPPPAISAPPLESNITFVGTWNKDKPDQCHTAIQALFDLNNCSDKANTNCIGPRYFAPPVHGNYVAFSGFYYTASFFNQTNTNFTHWGDYKSNVTDFCDLSYQEAAAGVKDVNSFFYHRCFDALFDLYLLEQGMGFNSSAEWSVKFVDKYHGISAGWAMGYLLNATNLIPQTSYVEERPYSTVDMVVGIIVLSILCLIFMVFFCLTFYACRKVITSRSGYQDIA